MEQLISINKHKLGDAKSLPDFSDEEEQST